MIYKGLRRIRKDIDRIATNAPGGDLWYQFRVAPSCPPDKHLHIRSGTPIPSIRLGDVIENDFIPDTVCDFEDEDTTQMTLTFATANYYLPLILCYYYLWVIYQDSAYATFDNVIGEEVSTAAEAEAQIDGFLNGVEDWYNNRLPLCGVVLRNDGNIAVPYAIEPIDAVNRGRSYIYRDARSSGGIFA